MRQTQQKSLLNFEDSSRMDSQQQQLKEGGKLSNMDFLMIFDSTGIYQQIYGMKKTLQLLDPYNIIRNYYSVEILYPHGIFTGNGNGVW